jgi:hypothetical protein
MTTITPYAGAFTLADEGVHPVPEGNGNPDWSESFFFSFYDDEAGVGGAMRVGQELNNGTANCWYGIMSAEGWRYLHNGQDYPITDADRTAEGLGISWENGSSHLVFDEQGIGTFTGRCDDTAIDLRVENFHPMSQMWPIGEAGVHHHVEQTMAHGHFEGSGRATGTLTAHGQTYQIDALCHRDHSWGPREWKGFSGHRWIVGGLGEELSFSGLIAITTGGDETTGGVLQGGIIARGAEVEFLEHTDCILYLEPDGLTYRGGNATFYPPSGEPIHVELEPVNAVEFTIRDRYYMETAQLCRATDGEGRTGYAYLEASLNTRMGQFPVQHLISASVQEGYTEIDPTALPGRLQGLA